MTALIMGARALAFVLSEANGNLSYDEGTFTADNGVIEPGTALKTVAEKYVPATSGDTLTGFACYRVDTVGVDATSVVFKRSGEVKIPELIWDASFTTQALKDAALATLSSAQVIAR